MGYTSINAGDGANTVDLTLRGAFVNVSSGTGSDVIRLTGSGSAIVFDMGGNNTVDLSGLSAGGSAQITTGGGADTIQGSVGVDVISSGGGADSVNGGEGADQITGGAGVDTLTGGAGIDTFQDSVANLSDDRITDYQYGEQIVLTQALTSAAQVRLVTAGSDTEVQIDADNNGSFESVITLSGIISGRLLVTSQQTSPSYPGPYPTPNVNSVIRIVDTSAVAATSGNDLLIGTSGADVIDGLAGNGRLFLRAACLEKTGKGSDLESSLNLQSPALISGGRRQGEGAHKHYALADGRPFVSRANTLRAFR